MGAVLFSSTALVLALLCVMFFKVDLRIDREKLRIGFSTPRFPRLEIPRAEILSARVVRVAPMQHGGWGYRGSLRFFRKAAVVVRAGEGVAFALTEGRVLTVTVDDAAGCVRWLADDEMRDDSGREEATN
ncbi:hypothetical protein GGQ54_002619 [Naumannella cuiyingiana]|uniref:Uncharacterized protein n=1 Tax=Naumannella cuiyingiana TaxID=1347891 RepID=A0A7Z0DAL9_9ACTN|nr:hypothetical protein [Naumannella cuiyingiana]NYI72059.1 hypothetical protein [Naumannella cuiyingiana]